MFINTSLYWFKNIVKEGTLMNKHHTIYLVVLILLASLFMGCTDQKPGPGDLILPTITSFTSDDLEIENGQTATLSWIVENGTSVTISSSTETFSPQGTLTVQPNETTIYTLTAENEVGTVTDSLTITVNEPFNKDTPIFGFTRGQNYLLITYTDENLSWSNILINSEPVTSDDVDSGEVEWDGIIRKGDRLVNLTGSITLTWNPTDQSLGTWEFTIA